MTEEERLAYGIRCLDMFERNLMEDVEYFEQALEHRRKLLAGVRKDRERMAQQVRPEGSE